MKHSLLLAALVFWIFASAFATAATDSVDASAVVCSLDSPGRIGRWSRNFPRVDIVRCSGEVCVECVAGSIGGTGPEARWSLAGVAPGIYIGFKLAKKDSIDADLTAVYLRTADGGNASRFGG